MVKRDRKIAPRPTTPPAADEWIKSGGVDPEVQPALPTAKTEAEPDVALSLRLPTATDAVFSAWSTAQPDRKS